MFHRQGLFYWEKGYSVRINSERSQWSQSIAEYIDRVIARIGLQRPIYYEEYKGLFERIARRLCDGRGLQNILRTLRSDPYRKYGRLLIIDGFPRFEGSPLDSADGPVSWLSDWYICKGCGKTKNKLKDPPKEQFGYDYYQWSIGGKVVNIECCKKCRAEIRRIDRETRVLAENRRLINKLQREIKNVCNQNNG